MPLRVALKVWRFDSASGERALGHVQGEHALGRLVHAFDEGRDPYGPGSFPRPYLPGEKEETT